MERRRIQIDVAYLEIDDAKSAYIRTEKGVAPDDVREVVGLSPRYFVRQGADGPEYSILGPNQAGRYLVIAIATMGVPGDWRLITAYWTRESRGRRLYEEGA